MCILIEKYLPGLEIVNMHPVLVHVGNRSVCVSEPGRPRPFMLNRLPLVGRGSGPALIGQVEAIYSLTAPVT